MQGKKNMLFALTALLIFSLLITTSASSSEATEAEPKTGAASQALSEHLYLTLLVLIVLITALVITALFAKKRKGGDKVEK